MRQGHQNRRGRNRNNGGQRKGQNPVSRSYESNGPDVKIRGTPAHIAEKYMSLARDAQSNGDPVLAENYLQHGEHYNRIIIAYRDQQTQAAAEGQQRHRGNMPEPASFDEDGSEAEARESSGGSRPQPQQRANGERHPRQQGGRDRNNPPQQRPQRQPQSAQPEAGEPGVPEHEQPEFLRRSVRRPRRQREDESDQPVIADGAEKPD